MVETYGIPRVIDAEGYRFNRGHIEKTPQPFVKPLTCGGRNCTAATVAVTGHHRLKTWVEPMYRLGPGAQHTDGCLFNVDERMDALVKEHRAAIEPKNGMYRLMLQVVEKPTPVRPARPGIDEVGDPRQPAAIARHPTRTIPPVIKAATAVVRLLQDLEDDPVAKARFVAINYTPGGQELLSWDEFCWPATKSLELAADIKAHPGQPRVVWGRVAKAGPARSGTTGYIQLETSTEPKVYLRAKNQNFIAEKALNDYVLGFSATWELFPPNSPRSAPQTWITDSWMLSTWNAAQL